MEGGYGTEEVRPSATYVCGRCPWGGLTGSRLVELNLTYDVPAVVEPKNVPPVGWLKRYGSRRRRELKRPHECQGSQLLHSAHNARLLGFGRVDRLRGRAFVGDVGILRHRLRGPRPAPTQRERRPGGLTRLALYGEHQQERDRGQQNWRIRAGGCEERKTL